MGGSGALKSPTARWAPLVPPVLVAAGMALYGPITQLDHYHDFADKRAFLGVPNAFDVLSNAGFLFVAAWGLWRLDRKAPLGFTVFLTALVLTAFGSAYYHLAPDNARLVWDRIPIALACGGLIAGYYAATHATSQSLALNIVLAFAAVASVLWWSITERSGAGDLRPYLFLQVAPLLVVPSWQWVAGSPRFERIAFGIAIVFYAAAKVAELEDHRIFEAIAFMSGHTLKHLLAAFASVSLAVGMVRRFPAA